MATPILNSTQETCAICHKDYQDKEISDVSRVVELACRHFCHIGCISKSLRDQENGQRGLTHCNQKFTSSARAANVFTGQEIFQARLEEIGEDYDYDNEVMESVSVIADLYDSLHDLSNSFSMEPNDAVVNQAEEEELGFPQAVANLVIENKAIKEDLKPTVLQILAVMVAGDRALRTVDGEAERWKNVSFENWPDKIKQEGVLVRYKDEDIRMRVSANHLKKVVDKIFVDVLMNHYQKKAENFLQSIRFWTPRVLGVVTVAVYSLIFKLRMYNMKFFRKKAS